MPKLISLNTHRKEKLSEGDIKLINDNYSHIKKRIYNKLKKKKNTSIYLNRDSVYEAIGFLPEIICKEYNPDRAGEMDFVEFASQRCVFRLNDFYRQYYRTQLLKKKKEREQLTNKEKETHIMITEVVKQDPVLEQVEWNDLQNNLSTKIDTVFTNLSNRKVGKNKMPTSEVFKILLTDHIIPKSQGLDRKTLKEISERVLIPQSQLCKMVHSDKMKTVIKECLNID